MKAAYPRALRASSASFFCAGVGVCCAIVVAIAVAIVVAVIVAGGCNVDIACDGVCIGPDGGTGATSFVFCAFADVDRLGLQPFDDDDEDGSNVVCVDAG